MENNIPDFRNSQVAFESAISKGTFTEEHAVRVCAICKKKQILLEIGCICIQTKLKRLTTLKIN